MKYKKIEQMPKLRFPKMYFDVLDLLGAEPELEDDMAVCNQLDFNDAVTNLEIHIEDAELYQPADHEKVMAEIKKLNLQDYQLLAYFRKFYKDLRKFYNFCF